VWCVGVDLEILCGLEVRFDGVVVVVGGAKVVAMLDLAPPGCG
jgi:hypothetical protein